jgi:hypothetical protein
LPAFSLKLNATHNFFTLDRTLDELVQTVSSPDWGLPEEVAGLLIVAALVAVLIGYRKGFNPRIPLLVLGGVGWQVYFSTTIYGLSLQRAFLSFFILVFAFWIVERRNRLLGWILILLSVLSLQRFPEVWRDFQGAYTPAKEIAEALQDSSKRQAVPIYTDNMTKVISAYAPSLMLLSLREGGEQPLYTPHTLYRDEPFEVRVDSAQGGAIYYVRTHIGIDRFLKHAEAVKDKYAVEQVIPRKDAPPYIRELFYLYRISRVLK